MSREEQDEFAARVATSARRPAWKNGVFDDEMVPIEVPQRRGDPVLFAEDEGIRPETTVESLAKLRPGVRPDGTITAGSASQISDGACAVVVMSRAKADELGLAWLAEIGAHGIVAGPDSSLQSQPAAAIRHACAKDGIKPADLDVIEINEAFAAVGHRESRGSSASTRIGSTSTAAPSRWGTRSACPALGWCCTPPWSCAAAAAEPEPPPCVVAAARATP